MTALTGIKMLKELLDDSDKEIDAVILVIFSKG
jgi:hypothetical protein